MPASQWAKRRAKSAQAQKVTALVPALVAWFAKNARDLPWRRTHDPYAIWISEIMLQQTQVKTVLPYWDRWMRKLPTIQSAAKASPARLHKLWEGLGYYVRVRNLQKAAQQIVTQHGGKFPNNFDDILALPGVGRYTAGAICSIAFNKPRPILDGNVIRVLTRIFGIHGNPHEKKTNARLWQLAEVLVKQAAETRSRNTQHGTRNTSNPPQNTHRVSDACSCLNQSLMELGALICTPRQPDCGRCPIANHCAALQRGRVEELPYLRPRTAPTPRRFAAFVAERHGCLLVRKRPAGVVNAHLWELPNLELSCDHPDLRAIACRVVGVAPAKLELLCTIRHSITRYRITLEAYRVQLRKLPLKPAGVWLTRAQLRPLAFTSAHKRVLLHLEKTRRQPPQ